MHHTHVKIFLIPLFQFQDGSRTHIPLKNDILLKNFDTFIVDTLEFKRYLHTSFYKLKAPPPLKKLSRHLTLQAFNNEHQVIFQLFFLEPLFNNPF